jgi:gliding motility-associated-like protein
MLCAYLVKGETGYTCQDALPLTNIHGSCSDSARYDNTAPAQNGITWFKFVADSDAINITVNGYGTGGTLKSPVITLFSDCAGATMPGLSSATGETATTFYAENLIPGNTYYIAVSGTSNQTGTFKLCVDNTTAIVDASDCEKSIFISTIFERYCRGTLGTAGVSPTEGDGTCLGPNLQHKVWFKWQATTSGALTFTLTPMSPQGHINFVLYDLGTSGDCSNVTSTNALRCLAGYGDAPNCSAATKYSIVGLSTRETDHTEQRECSHGQNGELMYLPMIKNHVYGLLVNEDLLTDPRYCLTFDDGASIGAGIPIGYIHSPDPDLTYLSANSSCPSELTYTFTSHSLSYHRLRWDFGAGSTLVNIDANRNYTVHYSTPGVKKVTLYATDDIGYTAVVSKTFTIDVAPVIAKPVIKLNRTSFCYGDTILLSTQPVAGLKYVWKGPNNFTSTQPQIQVIANNTARAGNYTLTAYNGGCPGPTASINIPAFFLRPVADFNTTPFIPAILVGPATVQFINQSTNADSYLWEFGDGSTSTQINPSHKYVVDGTYSIKLTAFQSTACSNDIVKGTFIIHNALTIFIPNTFTPNGDGTNDTFGVNINNIKTFHMIIYNRWGQPLFESTQISQKWDGTYKNSPVPVGVFYYVLNAVSEDGVPVNRAGHLTLLR